MAKKATTQVKDSPASGESAARAQLMENLITFGAKTGQTGRCIVIYRQGQASKAAKMVRDQGGLETISTSDFSSGFVSDEQTVNRHLLLENLDIGVVTMDPDDMMSMANVADSPIEMVVAEQILYLDSGNFPGNPGAIPIASPFLQGAFSADYVRGFRDGINSLAGGILQGGGLIGGMVPAPQEFRDSRAQERPTGPQMAPSDASTAQFTWGVIATRANTSPFTGAGIRVAILDTGLDLNHEDFQDGRVVATQSFVGQPVQDVITPRDPFGRWPGNPGHGSHCTGIACGPKESAGVDTEGVIRYGVACGADICIGKVFMNDGRTTGGAILEAISWAVTQKCRVVSLSLGAPGGQTPNPAYELAGKRALDNNVVLVAAAGNRSDRRVGKFACVDSPADCMSFMAIAAIDRFKAIAYFSNQGQFPPAGAVNLAGPGVDVYSSLPGGYGRLSGTSMATPHVAGIAALIAEANPSWTARDIMNGLTDETTGLVLPIPGLDEADAGHGLAQAPQGG